MGLDIKAYEKATFVRSRDEERSDDVETAHEEDLKHVWTYDSYEARLRDMPPGWYRTEGEEHDFRAGSYGGYSRWRDQLAKAVHHKPARDVWAEAEALEGKALEGEEMPAFYELIHFADNEGCIGPAVSKKLARDFQEYKLTFMHWLVDNVEEGLDRDWALSRYEDWQKAFELAAKGGFVDFC